MHLGESWSVMIVEYDSTMSSNANDTDFCAFPSVYLRLQNDLLRHHYQSRSKI